MHARPNISINQKPRQESEPGECWQRKVAPIRAAQQGAPSDAPKSGAPVSLCVGQHQTDKLRKEMP